MQVLDSTEPTLLLGRRFIGNLGPITFDWGNSRVRVGATPLARAMVANQDEDEVRITEEQKDNLISGDLGKGERLELNELLSERVITKGRVGIN